MNLQIIHSTSGQPEFFLLPIKLYHKISEKLKTEISALEQDDYVPFVIEDYIDNPVALARMKAHVTQAALAEAMKVSQAYISKLEAQKTVSAKVLSKVNKALTP
jgi:predicted transcriptional regulator